MKRSYLISFATFSSILLSGGTASAHPGHDHHLPQEGLLHWITSPFHLFTYIAIILGAAGTFLLYRKWRSSRRPRHGERSSFR